MTDPLHDTVFRPTTLSPFAASALPVRARGVHTRAGNAMSRTRAALLAGAAASVQVSGTKIAMAQVAQAAGVAKATLYNHFRTREAVLSGLVQAEAAAIVEAQAGKPLERALVDAATAISDHPVRVALARSEPAALAAMGAVDLTTPGWQIARSGVTAALAADGRGGTATVLRWLASFLLTPGTAASIAADAAVLVAGLPARPVPGGATAHRTA